MLYPLSCNNCGNNTRDESNPAAVFNPDTLLIPDNHEYLPVNNADRDAEQT